MHPSVAKMKVGEEIDPKDRLIVALDVQDISEARRLVERLEGTVSFFKVGLRLQLADGVLDFVQELISKGNKVFLDYKYLDIEETVEKAVARVAGVVECVFSL
jgi:orotidine-5'-phosphate decarboxylase